MDGDGAETLYWIRDDEGGLIGIDISKSKTMVIEMKNNSVSRIKGYKDIAETLYPENDLKESSRYLQGFLWHDDLRPTSKSDIFRRVKSETPQADPEIPQQEGERPAAEVTSPKRHRNKKGIL